MARADLLRKVAPGSHFILCLAQLSGAGCSDRTIALMPSYRWSCLACGVVNTQTSERCESCACSATPTFAEIQDAKKSAGIVEPVDGPTLAELAGAFKAYLTGKPGERGLVFTAVFELVSCAIVIFFLIFLFEVCKSLGIL